MSLSLLIPDLNLCPCVPALTVSTVPHGERVWPSHRAEAQATCLAGTGLGRDGIITVLSVSAGNFQALSEAQKVITEVNLNIKTGMLVENHVTIYARVDFWALYYVPVVELSVFMGVPCCVNNVCSFVGSFGIRKCVFQVCSFFSRWFWLFGVP